MALKPPEPVGMDFLSGEEGTTYSEQKGQMSTSKTSETQDALAFPSPWERKQHVCTPALSQGPDFCWDVLYQDYFQALSSISVAVPKDRKTLCPNTAPFVNHIRCQTLQTAGWGLGEQWRGFCHQGDFHELGSSC